MGDQDRRADIKRLIDTLRRVTTAVQIMPFIYSGLYIITLVFYNFASQNVQSILDTLFYVSPICIIAFLLLSRLLHLCIWHKTACIIPFVPQVVSAIDCYFFIFPVKAIYIFNGTLILMSSLLLVSAYNVFLR